MQQKDIFNFKSTNFHSFSIFTSSVTWKWNVGTLTQVSNTRPQQKLLLLFYVKKCFRLKKSRRQKLMTLLIKKVLFSFETRKYAGFAEMNMIYMTITKAQLLSFDSLNTYLRNFVTLFILKFVFLINRLCLSCVVVFFL